MNCDANEILSKNVIKEKTKNKTPVELFELFFSTEIKCQIMEATRLNGLDLNLYKFNNFIGILIFSNYNSRKQYTDYWSDDSSLHCF